VQQEQLNREPRLERVQQLAREYEHTLETTARESNNEAAEALMALVGV